MTEFQMDEKYEEGPKYFRNLNFTPKRHTVQGSAITYRKPTIF